MNRTAPIFLIILAVAIFYVYIDPAYADIRQLQVEEKAYAEAIESVRAVEQKRNELILKYNSFSSVDLDRLDEMIPSTIDNMRLVAEINGIAQQYDIEIRRVRVAEYREGNIPREGTVTEGIPDVHKMLTMSFTFDAPYDSFIKFMNDLEQSLRILDFSSISFRVESDTQEATYNVTLRTYWLP
ncbi:MAG: hypothetical protein KAR00_00555 [Candidatus Pacebacteria bacterium]|nr:hypothetical protein [Candidatus Paceibacterota bacterium]